MRMPTIAATRKAPAGPSMLAPGAIQIDTATAAAAKIQPSTKRTRLIRNLAGCQAASSP